MFFINVTHLQRNSYLNYFKKFPRLLLIPFLDPLFSLSIMHAFLTWKCCKSSCMMQYIFTGQGNTLILRKLQSLKCSINLFQVTCLSPVCFLSKPAFFICIPFYFLGYFKNILIFSFFSLLNTSSLINFAVKELKTLPLNSSEVDQLGLNQSVFTTSLRKMLRYCLIHYKIHK